MKTQALILLTCLSATLVEAGPIGRKFFSAQLDKAGEKQGPQIKGLVLVSGEWDVLDQKAVKLTRAFQVNNLTIPGGSVALEKQLLPIYIDKPLTNEIIEELKLCIYRYYRSQGYPLIEVRVPAQNISSGVLQLIICHSRLDKITIQGNSWSSERQLMRYMELKKGDLINEALLSRDVDFMNRYPFRSVDAVYRPGEKPETTDVDLIVKDRTPFRFYVGADDTGVETTGRNRFLTGFSVGGLFGFDNCFTYQFTSAYNIQEFYAHTAQWAFYLPWRHIINVYGGYASLHAHLPAPSIHHHGQSSQASLRYKIPLEPIGNFAHEIDAGFDFKRTNNTLQFSELLVAFGKNVNLTQLALTYAATYKQPCYLLDFGADLYWSPGQWIADQSNADYESLRPDAKNHWVYTRGYLKYVQNLPKCFSWSNLVRIQLASQNLLPSEQMGIGGYDTVRGYDERQLNFDGAFLASSEVISPSMCIYKKKEKDSLRFLAFVDYGYGKNHNSIPGEGVHNYLLGVGPGLRYVYGRNITIRCDYGFKLHKQPDFTGGIGRIHYSAILSF